MWCITVFPCRANRAPGTLRMCVVAKDHCGHEKALKTMSNTAPYIVSFRKLV